MTRFPQTTARESAQRAPHASASGPSRLTRRDRAFALVLVLLLVLTGGIALATAVQRLGAQELAARRHLDRYSVLHYQRGMAEILDDWVGTLSSLELPELLGQETLVLRIELANGDVGYVHMGDGQARVLTDFAGLSGQPAADARLMAEELELRVADPDPRVLNEYTRDGGPVPVTARFADRLVLQSAAAAALADSLNDPPPDPVLIADAIIAARDSGRTFNQSAISEAVGSVGVIGGDVTAINRLILAEPAVWAMRIDVWTPDTPSRRGRLAARFLGLVQTEQGATLGEGRRIINLEPVGERELEIARETAVRPG